MKNMKDKVFEIRKPKPRFPVIKEIENRFSPRHFSSTPIPQNHLDSIFEAARFAPSGFNFEPWYFYWSKNGEESFKRIVSCLAKYNRYAAKAPVLIIGCFIKKVRGRTSYYRHDLGAAVMSLVLQAQHLGYYARQIGEFKKNKLRKLLAINREYHPFVVIALGRLGDYNKIDDTLLKRDLFPRPRKEDFVKKI